MVLDVQVSTGILRHENKELLWSCIGYLKLSGSKDENQISPDQGASLYNEVNISYPRRWGHKARYQGKTVKHKMWEV